MGCCLIRFLAIFDKTNSMKSIRKKYLIFLLLLISFSVSAQKKLSGLDKQVMAYNDALQYEKSIQLLSDFISDEKNTPFEKYTAYLYKAHTYKRLFNYPETLHNLSLALEEGLKSDKTTEVRNNIAAEQAFVYFDTQDYDKATALMQQLNQVNYRYLTTSTKAWIVMQEGYLLLRKNEFSAAEQKLDYAIAILKAHSPRDLPNIYGKKIELYNEMKLYDKREAAFKTGISYAKKYQVLKYELYLYEILRNIHQQNHDYKKAFEFQVKFDSLNQIYNATNHNGKIELLEKKLTGEKNDLILKNEKQVNYFLIGLSAVLLILLLISYRLYNVNKEKRLLAEKENSRIHHEIDRLTREIDEKGDARLDLSKYQLTERQVEVVQLIRQGKTNREIANSLFISENTVKYHLKTIYEILQIEHRRELR